MILFNGRLDAELKGKDAAALGRSDAAAAMAGALREVFRQGDCVSRSGGGRRLLPEQSAYLFSWIQASALRIQAWCLLQRDIGPDGASKISTGLDILSHDHDLALW